MHNTMLERLLWQTQTQQNNELMMKQEPVPRYREASSKQRSPGSFSTGPKTKVTMWYPTRIVMLIWIEQECRMAGVHTAAIQGRDTGMLDFTTNGWGHEVERDGKFL